MKRLGMLLLSIVAAGCDDGTQPPRSSDVPDERFTVAVTLRSNGAVAQLLALPSEEHTAVVLSGGDRFLGGPIGEPEEGLVDTESGYAAQFTTTAETFTIALVRGSGARFEATLVLPPAFAVTVPEEPVSRAGPIEITWTPADPEAPMNLELHGPCLSTPMHRHLQVDTGSHTVQPADLFVSDPSSACDLDLFVTRARAATAALDGLGPPGPAQLEQVRDLVLSTTP